MKKINETLEFELNDGLKDNTSTFATSFRESNLTDDEDSALNHLLDMMTGIKQQVLFRKALHKKFDNNLSED